MEEIDQMIEILEAMVERVAESTKLTNGIAKFTRNLYDSFIEAGFTGEDAFELTLATIKATGKK